jgi:hypothetical protein
VIRRRNTKEAIIIHASFFGNVKKTRTTKDIVKGIQEVMSVTLTQKKSNFSDPRLFR